jgi:hypothetical protein
VVIIFILQCWLLFEVVFVFFLFVETRGPTLEEIAKIFDGEDAEVAHIEIDGAEGVAEKFDTVHIE